MGWGLNLSIFLQIGYLWTFSVSNEKLDKPLILWWYDTIFPHVEYNGKEFYDVSCNDGHQCYASKNRNLIKENHIASIIFYGSDFEPDDLPLPRSKQHLWALLHEESPLNNFLLLHGRVLELFNFTSTFKSSSDYPLTTQYIPSVEYIFKRAPLSVKEKNWYRATGLAPVVYVQSNCDVPSDRDRYVAKLMKHLKIDSYGDCLHNKNFNIEGIQGMENLHSDEFLDLISRYKFHIAFENSICDDYITEKLHRAFHVGSVPIYMGASNVEKWSPNNSVIQVSDFQSPEALSDFVMKLDKNEAEYSVYLDYKKNDLSLPKLLKEAILHREWSTDDSSTPHFIEGFECFVCEQMRKLMNNDSMVEFSKSPPAYVACPAPKPSVDEKLLLEDKLNTWIAEYEQSSLLSTVLADVVQQNNSDSIGVWDILKNAMYREHSEL